jgi:hypothetical protein
VAYTFGDLKTKLATQISDPNVDTTITGDALIDAEQEIFNKFDITLNSATQSNTVAVNTNTPGTSLPTNLQRIRNVNITAPLALAGSLKKNYLDPDAFDEQCTAYQQSVVNPLAITPWTYYAGGVLTWGNLADQAYTILIRYTKYVPFMSADADVPTIPQAFRELLMLGAKIRVYENKEDFDFAQQFQNRYADLLQDFLTRYSTRQVDTQPNVGQANRGRAVRV